MEKILIFIAALGVSALLIVTAQAMGKPHPVKWAVYYGAELPAETFMPYELIVFDSQAHPPLRPLMNRGKTLLGYLSVGEMEASHPDFAEMQRRGIILSENKNWPGRYAVDIRRPEWAKYLIEVRIPHILHQKFDGLMLDTIDTSLALESSKAGAARRYPGMSEAAVQLIHTIRRHNPRVPLMLNRGFSIIPQIVDRIDYLLAESILVNYPIKQDYAPAFFPDEVLQEIDKRITVLREANPALQVLTLDYWDPEDTEKIMQIYQKQRARGYAPYVTTLDIMQHVPEPM